MRGPCSCQIVMAVQDVGSVVRLLESWSVCPQGGGQKDTGQGFPDFPGAGFVRMELSVGVRELWDVHAS